VADTAEQKIILVLLKALYAEGLIFEDTYNHALNNLSKNPEEGAGNGFAPD